MANKRARLKCQEPVDLGTSDSGSNDTCTSDAELLQPAAHEHSVSSIGMPLYLATASFDFSVYLSSDVSDSDSSENCWDRVDQLIFKISDSSDSDGEGNENMM